MAPEVNAVENGEIQYLSVSQVTTANQCLRKWFFEKVLRKRPPQTKSQGVGTALHEDIERYLKTGVNALGPLAMTGKHLLPEPGPDLWVEQPIDALGLTLDGIRFIGAMDLLHTRGINKGASEIEEVQDPPGTAEVCDHKTTKGSRSDPYAYCKTPKELSTDIQMVGYGEVARRSIYGLEHIRLSHHYFFTAKPLPAVKKTILLPVEEIRETWESFTPIVRSMRQVVTSDVSDVPGNVNACDAYGGCPHRTYCSLGNPLAALLSTVKENTSMGLLDKVLNKPDISDQLASLAKPRRASSCIRV